MVDKPVLAIVSPQLRRDLHDPLRFFTRLTVHHFYAAALGDVGPDDWRGGEHRYTGAGDLLAQLRELKPALVQGCEPTWFPPSLPVCRATAQLAGDGVPLYFPVLENRPLADKFTAPGGWLMRRYLAWYARKAQLVYAVNDGARANLLAAGVPEEKIRKRLYGTWGVDLDEFSPGAGPRERLILFAGRLEEEKGVFDLLTAFTRCAGKCDARLVFAGDGPRRAELMERVTVSGLAGRVEFAGMVPNRDMPALLRRALVTCVPSRTMRGWSEQVGMVNLQSMACGTPVVTTDSGANPEMVGDAGALVAEGEGGEPLAHGLADKIIKLFTDPAYWQLCSSRGRARAETHFNARHNIAAIEDELLQLLDR